MESNKSRIQAVFTLKSALIRPEFSLNCTQIRIINVSQIALQRHTLLAENATLLPLGGRKRGNRRNTPCFIAVPHGGLKICAICVPNVNISARQRKAACQRAENRVS